MLKKITPGQVLRSLPSQEWNAFVDAADATRNLKADLRRRLKSTVRVRNETGVGIQRFYVLGISDILIDPSRNPVEFKDNWMLRGIIPDAQEHVGNFVIALEGADDNASAICTIDGTTPVQLDVVAENHQYADIKDGDATQLQSSDAGSARILYKEAGTGTKWALVELRAIGHGMFVGKSTSSITAAVDGANRTPGAGTVQRYEKDSAGDLITVGDPFDVENWTVNSVETDTWVICDHDRDQIPYLIGEECILPPSYEEGGGTSGPAGALTVVVT
jgi:hypothetical protein